MGRVRKYKKIKTIDPFSKRKPQQDNSKYDYPPDLNKSSTSSGESRTKKKRKVDLSWENEDDVEILLQMEAKRMLNQESLQMKKIKKSTTLESKKDDESMKSFKERIRQETRVTLRDELKGMTATAKKRKEWLKEQKLKKKTSKKSVLQEEDFNEFNSSEKGAIRPSDRGAPSSFPKSNNTVVGLTVSIDRPLDLLNFVDTKHAQIIQRNKDKLKGTSQSKVEEMEQVRQKAQEAYAKIKAKRRMEDGYKSFTPADRL